MNSVRAHPGQRGFTLVEILVVVSIIILLVALMVPAFSVVRTRARVTQTASQISSLESGLEAFRGEQALGSIYPPSRSDFAEDRQKIADPNERTSAPNEPNVKVTGAHLLLMAMLGADLLGTPGFKDLDYDQIWADDTHAAAGGLHELDQTTGAPKQPRYGGAGYVGDKMTASVRTLQQLQEKAVVAAGGMPQQIDALTLKQRLFVDPWEHPILYYRANPAAMNMVGVAANHDAPGIYKQQDNALIAGFSAGGTYQCDGIDFGGRALGATARHGISVTAYPSTPVIPPSGDNEVLENAAFVDSFTRFILDGSVQARYTPVRKDTYLLISAGPDAVYGTSDDVTNWEAHE
ncbi:MAG TPA: type II secretion system protein [Phycisphaerae bacterium]|nr:type II secretion system protein [Phycisphaerae bacterium]HNU45355.1 type II secretion system protein [Phycisphaerae bacterium]